MPKDVAVIKQNTPHRDGETDEGTFYKYHDNDAVALMTIGYPGVDKWSILVINKSSGPISGNLVFRNGTLDSPPIPFELGVNEKTDPYLEVEAKYVSSTGHYFVNVDGQNIGWEDKLSQVELR
jgi:hypothetical protein